MILQQFVGSVIVFKICNNPKCWLDFHCILYVIIWCIYLVFHGQIFTAEKTKHSNLIYFKLMTMHHIDTQLLYSDLHFHTDFRSQVGDMDGWYSCHA